jgi:hypothetical protein
MGVLNFIKRIFTWWDGQTLGTQLWTWRNGKKVGEDGLGNIYYTNTAGTRRWVKLRAAASALIGMAGCTIRGTKRRATSH